MTSSIPTPASGLWPARLSLNPPRPRGEGDSPPADPPAPAIDATNPEVQKLIAGALAAFKATADDEKAKILANKDQILAEKKQASDERERLKAELEEIRTKTKAGEHGVDPDKYKADVEQAAQQKFSTFAEEHKLVLADRETKLKEAGAEIEQLKTANRRAAVESVLVQAMIPPGEQVVHPGAWKDLVTLASEIIEWRTADGVKGEIPRVVVNGAILPTMNLAPSSDGMMTPAELMIATRLAKGPLAEHSYKFRSNGEGSHTETPSKSSGGAGRKWSSLSDAERGRMWGEDAEAAKKMVDADLQERQRAATPRARAAVA